MFTDAATEDFFRVRLDHMIDLRHALAVLASRMPWQQIEALVAHLFSRKANPAAAGGIRGWRLDAVGIPPHRDRSFRRIVTGDSDLS